MAVKNLARATIKTAPSPATSGTTMELETGQGAWMPATPFALTICGPTEPANPLTAEIVTVETLSGDKVTAMKREQYGTAARSVKVGDVAVNPILTTDISVPIAEETTRAEAAEALKLAIANNLSDLADTGSSRANLHTPIYTTVAAVVTTALGAAPSGLKVIDGYTTKANDLVLVTAQAAPAENGLWLAQTTAWTRPTEMAAAGVITGTRLVATSGKGKEKPHTWWMLSWTENITVGTTVQTWEQFSPLVNMPSAEVTAEGTLTVGQITKVKLGKAGTMKLPVASTANYGKLIVVENGSVVSAIFALTVEGPIRGSGTVRLELPLTGQTVTFLADNNGYWWPIGEGFPLGGFWTRLPVRPGVIAGETLTIGEINEVIEAGTVKLPLAAVAGFGKLIAVVNESAGTVTVQGQLRESGSSTLTLPTLKQTVLLIVDQKGYWWPVGEAGAGGLIKAEVEEAVGAALTTNESYKAEVLADGPLVYLRCSDASPGEGATAADSSGNGRNGKYHGGAVLAESLLAESGDYNQAIGLGATGYITIPNSAGLELAGEVTVEALLTSTAFGNRGIIGRPGYELLTTGNNLVFRTRQPVTVAKAIQTGAAKLTGIAEANCEKIKVGMAVSGAGIYLGTYVTKVETAKKEVLLSHITGSETEPTITFLSEVEAQMAPQPGRPFHVLAQSVPSATTYGYELKIWINGTLMITRQGCAGENTKAEVFIGANTSGGELWEGTIDEVAIYGTGLSEGRIQNHAIIFKPRIQPVMPPSRNVSAYQRIVERDEPVMYLRCNEPKGSTFAHDYCGNSPGEYGAVGTGECLLRQKPLIIGDPTAASVYLKGTTAESANGGFISILNRLPLQPTKHLTVEMWVEMVEEVVGGTGQQTLFTMTEETRGEIGWWTGLSSPEIPGVNPTAGYGYPYFGAPHGDGFSGPLLYANTHPFTAGKVHLLTFTFEPEHAKIYIDGVLEAAAKEETGAGGAKMPKELIYAGFPEGYVTAPPAGIGSQSEWKFGHIACNCRVSEVALYNKTLGAVPIEEHAKVGKGEPA